MPVSTTACTRSISQTTEPGPEQPAYESIAKVALVTERQVDGDCASLRPVRKVGLSVDSVNDDSIIVAGYGKFPQGTSAEQLHKVLAVVALVDRRTGVVADVSTTLATRTADEFICRALVGKSLITEAASFVEFLISHYHGLAQRAVVAAFRDLVRRYTEATAGQKAPGE